MVYKILHLIDNVDAVNYGIWNAALMNSSLLIEKNMISYAVFPFQDDFSYPDVKTCTFKKTDEIFNFLQDNSLTVKNTLVVSHGCWQWPTRIGHLLRKNGFKWTAVPHGMLEPWSINQKRIKKYIYYHLIERRLLKKSDLIRAVSKPEYSRLSKTFGSKVIHIPNGINAVPHPVDKKPKLPIRFLFMARLHHKKGVLPLIHGWLQSPLANNINYILKIAGPDDGELQNIKVLVDACDNIDYIGPVYGKEKRSILLQSHIYLLPSFSEGFPSSVLEAMDYGLLPLISTGCNFPEAFENDLVIELKPNSHHISQVLLEISKWSLETIVSKGLTTKKYVAKHYTNEIVSNQIYDMTQQLLGE